MRGVRMKRKKIKRIHYCTPLIEEKNSTCYTGRDFLPSQRPGGYNILILAGWNSPNKTKQDLTHGVN